MSAPAAVEVKTQPRGWVFAFLGERWPLLATAGMLALLWGRFLATLVFDWKVDPQYAHGWYIPLLALILLGSRWSSLPAARPGRARGLALALIVAALLALVPLAFLQQVYPEARPFAWAHALLVGAITFGILFLHGGLRWVRHLAFPVVFLLLAVPWPRAFQHTVADTLMRAVAAASVEVTLLMGTPAVQHGNTIGLAESTVGIDEACSGIQSLHGSLIIGLFLGGYFAMRALPRVALLVLALFAGLLLNVVRTTTLTWISANRGSQALDTFHDPAGLAILAAVFVLCLFAATYFSRRWPADDKAAPMNQTGAERHRAKRSSTQNAVILSEAEGSLASGAERSGAAAGKTYEPPRRFTPQLVTLSFTIIAVLVSTDLACRAWFGPLPPAVPSAEWQLDYSRFGAAVQDARLSPTAQRMLRFDSADAKSIQRANGTQVRLLDLRWRGGEISAAGARLHHPSVCLPATGQQVQAVTPFVPVRVHGREAVFSGVTVSSGGQKAYAYHMLWENGAPAKDGAGYDQSLGSAIRAVKERRRLTQARVLLLMLTGPADDAHAAAELQQFFEEAVVAPPVSS